MAKIEAQRRADTQHESDIHDLVMQRMRAKEKERRDTVETAVRTNMTLLGKGVKEFINEPKNVF